MAQQATWAGLRSAQANCNVLRLSDRAEFGGGDRRRLTGGPSDADAAHSMMQGVDAVGISAGVNGVAHPAGQHHRRLII